MWVYDSTSGMAGKSVVYYLGRLDDPGPSPSSAVRENPVQSLFLLARRRLHMCRLVWRRDAKCCIRFSRIVFSSLTLFSDRFCSIGGPVSIDTAHIYVLCISIPLALSYRSLPISSLSWQRRTKYEGWNLRSADEAIGFVVERPSVNSLSFSLIHGGRLCHRVQVSTRGIPMFGRTLDSGIFVVDTKECRKRPEKFKSRKK